MGWDGFTLTNFLTIKKIIGWPALLMFPLLAAVNCLEDYPFAECMFHNGVNIKMKLLSPASKWWMLLLEVVHPYVWAWKPCVIFGRAQSWFPDMFCCMELRSESPVFAIKRWQKSVIIARELFMAVGRIFRGLEAEQTGEASDHNTLIFLDPMKNAWIKSS